MIAKHNTFSVQQIAVWSKERLFFLSLGIAFVGTALRLRQYVANRSLWRDEASLALNILERSFTGLVYPLDDDQGAPLLFLWIQKGFTTLLGSSEYVLRFFPLLCGIISIFTFWFIASRYLSKRATFFALTLFAISDLLIDLSSEVKQYSFDIQISILALILFFFLMKHQNFGYILAIGYGLLGAILIWASYPAIFLLAAVGIATLYSSLLSKNYERIKFLVIMGSFWVISFLILYVVSLTSLTSNQYLLDSWRSGFPPSLSRPLAVIEWVISRLLDMFVYPGGLATFGLGAFLYTVGVISLYRRDKIIVLSLFLPIVFAMFASFLAKYPFSNRLILFLAPLLLIPVAEGIEQMFNLILPTPFRLAAAILVVILFFFPVLEASKYLYAPKLKEEIRPVLEHVQENWQEGDMMYVYYGAYKPFKYYQRNFGFQDSDYTLGIESRYQWVNYLPDLSRLRNYRRVWIVFSHVHSGNGVNEEELMINWLNSTGATQKDWFPRAGASSYLYEFN